MAAGPTYDLITSYTVSGTSTFSVTFNSLGSYTDLLIVTSHAGNYPSNDRTQMDIRFNGDTSNSYSYFEIYGYDPTAVATQVNDTDRQYFGLLPLGPSSSVQKNQTIMRILNYTNSSYVKTFLRRSTQMNNSNNTPQTSFSGGRWNNTNAITSITIFEYSLLYYFYAGTTINLYGIKAA